MTEQTLKNEPSAKHTLGAIFLVAGTCVGGGMLALPLMTGLSGLFPSSIMLIVCWMFMAATGLLFLEANLWLGSGKHIITMAQELLGPAGKWVTLILYLFICYVSLIAYVSVGSDLILNAIGPSGIFLNRAGACLLFGAFFALFIYMGTYSVGRINALLMTGMIFSYFALLFWGFKEIHFSYFKYFQFKSSILAIPILLTSFSFQTMMPSLTPYLRGNARSLRIAIIAGTALPLIAYLIWDVFILGTVPLDGKYGLRTAMLQALPITEPLRRVVQNIWVSRFAAFFAFFALVTSFLGISLGLYDFIADWFGLEKRGFNKIWLTLCVFVPTIIGAILFPGIFLVALDSTGGYGDAILNGIIPVLMVWRGRYLLKKEGPKAFPGNKMSLSIIFLFAVFVVILETLMRFNVFKLSA